MVALLRPAGGRVGGGLDAVAVNERFVPNYTPAGDFVVRVVDTGFFHHEGAPHPWLAEHLDGHDRDDVEPIPSSGSTMLARHDGHGTFVSGLILREAPAARVRMTRTPTWADADVAAAIAKAIGRGGRQLLNLSFSGATSAQRRRFPTGIQTALRALTEESVVVVAAGNDGSSDLHYPGGLPDLRARVITVGAVDQTMRAPFGGPPELAGFSNHGAWVTCYADGVQLLGPHCIHTETAAAVPRVAQDFRGWARQSGTSGATAVVCGRIARAAMDKDLSLREAAELVVDGADLIPVPTENAEDDERYWRPYVRGVGSTWGEITLTAPSLEP